jgi:hypothetical protein
MHTSRTAGFHRRLAASINVALPQIGSLPLSSRTSGGLAVQPSHAKGCRRDPRRNRPALERRQHPPDRLAPAVVAAAGDRRSLRADRRSQPRSRLCPQRAEGLRFPGTNLFGSYIAGTYWKFWDTPRVRSFWVRRHAESCITLRLQGHWFDVICVEVDDPEREVARIRAAIAEQSPGAGAETA